MNGTEPEDRDEILSPIRGSLKKAHRLVAEIHNDLKEAPETFGTPAIPKPMLGSGNPSIASSLKEPPTDARDTVDHPQDDFRGDWGEKIVRGRDPAHMAELIRDSEIYLTDRQAQVLKLHLVGGMSVGEMAHKLHRAPSTVCEHLKKGMKVLKAHCARLRDEERQARAKFLLAHPEWRE